MNFTASCGGRWRFPKHNICRPAISAEEAVTVSMPEDAAGSPPAVYT
jgi:hypothetical protein